LLEKIIKFFLPQLSIFLTLKTNKNLTSIIYIYKKEIHKYGNLNL